MMVLGTFTLQMHQQLLWSMQLSALRIGIFFFLNQGSTPSLCQAFLIHLTVSVRSHRGTLDKGRNGGENQTGVVHQDEEHQLGMRGCHEGSLHPWPRRSFFLAAKEKS